MEIIYIDPINDTRWYEFISRASGATIFHHPNWLKVLNRQYGFRVFAICKVDTEGKIRSGIPFCEVHSLTHKKKWISLPFSDFCNPLHSTTKDFVDLLRELKISYKMQMVDAIEIYSTTSENCNFNSVQNSHLHLLDIQPDEDAQMKTFDRTKRQGISKSQKQQLEVILSRNYSEMESFFYLHLITRKSKGIPVQPKSFFHRIHEHLIKQNLGFTIIIKKDNLDIAAGLFLNFNNILTYKYNASRADYQHLRPNNLIIWRALQEGIKEGFKTLDFGKTDLDNEGLRNFKLGWGAKEYNNIFSYYPAVPVHDIFGALKDKVVAPIIRKSPGIICQFLGEVGYKYFPSI